MISIDRAMWHFSRGLAFAAQKQPEKAASEHLEMGRLVRSEDAKKLDSPQFPATAMLGVAERWLAGKVAGKLGRCRRDDRAIAASRAGEDALPYMEAAFWRLPAPTWARHYSRRASRSTEGVVFREDVKTLAAQRLVFGLEQSLRARGKSDSADLVLANSRKRGKRADVKLDAWY